MDLRNQYNDYRCRLSNLAARLKKHPPGKRPPKRPFDRSLETFDQLTATVFACDPSPFLEQCLEAIEAQTLKPARLQIIKNVTPISLAFQKGLDLVETKYYVSVDEDMILFPRCFEQLYYIMNKRPGTGEVVLGLLDPMLGPIQGIHFYRTQAVKPIGFHPPRAKGPEQHVNRRLRESGWNCVTNRGLVVGLHHPGYSPLEAFWKFRFMGQSMRYHPLEKWNYYGSPPMFWHTDVLAGYWKRTGDLAALYALAGLFDGLQAEEFQEVLTYEGREQHPAFQRIHQYLSDFDNVPRTVGARLVEGWRRMKDLLGMFRP